MCKLSDYNYWILYKIVHYVILIIRNSHRLDVWDGFNDLHYVIVTTAYNCRLYIANL